MEGPASNRKVPVLVDFFLEKNKVVDRVECGGSQTFAFVHDK